jgi:hypothetical protein
MQTPTQREDSALRGMAAYDCNHPNLCLSVVEFDLSESAMQNSGRRERSTAWTMVRLCGQPHAFNDLDA